jgi:hypothetical protein
MQAKTVRSITMHFYTRKMDLSSDFKGARRNPARATDPRGAYVAGVGAAGGGKI